MTDDTDIPAEDYGAAIARAVADRPSFQRLTASGRRRNEASPWVKVTVRPVEVRGETRLQFSYFDGRKDVTRNYGFEEAPARLSEVVEAAFSNFHVQSRAGDLHVRVGKRGQVLLTRGRPSLTEEPSLAHDRARRHVLTPDNGRDFLTAAGILDRNGRVRPPMQAKFRQINAFLALTAPKLDALAPRLEGRPVRIVDCGCGSASLTLAAYAYLRDLRGVPARVQGVDSNGDLVRKCRGLAASLGWEDVTFEEARIAEYDPADRPDVVLSLHACDTATDEALARGVAWGSALIFAAPCCQRELLGQIDAPSQGPLLRHGILKARTADLVTDALRALILRIAGYKTDVVEFVSPEQTTKNLMIRAEAGAPKRDERALAELDEMKRFWGVQPCLERTVLGG